MKFKKVLVFLMCMASVFVLQADAVYADKNFLVNNAEEYADVLASEEDIMAFANGLFNHNGLPSVSAEQADWNKAYKIYVDESDIFATGQLKEEQLPLQAGYIWCLPIENQGKVARLTVTTRNPLPQNVVDEGIFTQEEVDQYNAEKAGTWGVSEGVLQDAESAHTLEHLMQDIDKAGISEESSIYLVGGTPRIRSLFAVTFDEQGQSDQVVLLDPQKWMSFLSDTPATASADSDIPVFGFEEFSELLDAPKYTDDESGGGIIGDVKETSTNAKNAKYAMWIIFGLFFLFMIGIGVRKAIRVLYKN